MFSVECYKKGLTKPYYFNSIPLENNNLSLDYYSSGIFTVMNVDEILDFIQTFFNENFIDRISGCRALTTFEIE